MISLTLASNGVRKMVISAVAALLVVLGFVVAASPHASAATSSHVPSVATLKSVLGVKTVAVPHRPPTHHATVNRQTKVNLVHHTVVWGDTVSQLAVTDHSSVHAIATQNGLKNVNLILVGQKLDIPHTSVVSTTVLSDDADDVSTPAKNVTPSVAPPTVHHHHSSAPVQHEAVTPTQTPSTPAPTQSSTTSSSSSSGGPMTVADLSPAWQCIVQHESGGQNLSYGDASSTGYFQIQQPTWNDYGGQQYAPSPYQATLAQQYDISLKILASQGPSAWSTNASFGCGL